MPENKSEINIVGGNWLFVTNLGRLTSLINLNHVENILPCAPRGVTLWMADGEGRITLDDTTMDEMAAAMLVTNI